MQRTPQRGHRQEGEDESGPCPLLVFERPHPPAPKTRRNRFFTPAVKRANGGGGGGNRRALMPKIWRQDKRQSRAGCNSSSHLLIVDILFVRRWQRTSCGMRSSRVDSTPSSSCKPPSPPPSSTILAASSTSLLEIIYLWKCGTMTAFH